MSGKSSIEWTGYTWNPIRARLKRPNTRLNTGKRAVPAGTWGYHCERVSPGCQHCYAERMNCRTLPSWGTALDYAVPSREKVEIYLDEEELLKPLHWKKPRMVFPCSMTDWCAEFVPNHMIYSLLAVMSQCPEHTFQCLTKRASRMHEVLSNPSIEDFIDEAGIDLGWCHANAAGRYPFPNVWLGVSVEDQPRADERISHLLATPAAIRWVSYEPALGPVDFTNIHGALNDCEPNKRQLDGPTGLHYMRHGAPGLDWLVCGGESGSGARSCDLAWLRSARDQCAAAGVPCFVKQLGARPLQMCGRCGPDNRGFCRMYGADPKYDGFKGHGQDGLLPLTLRDRKGGEPAEWPEDLRMRQMPRAAAGERG